MYVNVYFKDIRHRTNQLEHSSQTLTKLKTCDPSTLEGALEAALFLKDIASEAEARLERIGNWLWCLRDLPGDQMAPETGSKRSARSTPLPERTAKKAKEGDSAGSGVAGSSGVTGMSTEPQATQSRLRSGTVYQAGGLAHPATLKGWEALTTQEKKKELIRWWKAQCEELRQCEGCRVLPMNIIKTSTETRFLLAARPIWQAKVLPADDIKEPTAATLTTTTTIATPPDSPTR
jgi:hypothetical protein